MSDPNHSNDSNSKGSFSLPSGLSAWGASLRQSAQDVAAKAAAQVTELNAKVSQDVASSTNTASRGSVPNEPPKEKDLLKLLQTMNEKVKGLSAARQQLTEQVADLQQERQRWQQFVVTDILNDDPSSVSALSAKSSDQVLAQLKVAYQNKEEQHHLQLQQLQREFQKLQSETHAPADSVDSSHQQQEIQRIQQEAAQQLQDFKQKVAQARNAELQKVKLETATAAKKIMEAKLLEQKQLYENQQAAALATLREELTASSTNETSDGTTTEHQLLVEKTSECERLAQQLQEATASSSCWPAEKEALELERDTALFQIIDLKKELQVNSEQLEAQRQRVQEEKDVLLQERDQLKKRIETLQEQLLEQQSQSTDQPSSTELQQQLQAFQSTQTSLEGTIASLEQQLRETQNQLATQANDAVAGWQSQLSAAEEKHTTALQQLSSEHDCSIQKLREEYDAHAVSRESVVGELEQTTKRLMEELTALRRVADAEKAGIRQEMERQLHGMTAQVNETQQQLESLQSTQASLEGTIATLRGQLSETQEALGSQAHGVVASLQAQLSTAEEKYSTAMRQLTAEHEIAIRKLQEENEATSVSKESVLDLEQTAKRLAEELESVRLAAEAEKANLRLEMGQQLQQVTAQVKEKQQELNSLQSTHAAVEVKISTLEEQLRVAQETVVSQTNDMDASLQAQLSAAEEKHDQAIQKLSMEHESALQKLRDEYDAAMVPGESVAELEEGARRLTEELEAVRQAADAEKASMRQAMEQHVDQMTAQFKEKLDSLRTKATEEVNGLQKSMQEKDEKMAQLIEKFKALTATSTKLRDDNVALKSKLDAEMNTQKEIRAQLQSTKKQLEDTVANSSATATSLLKQQEFLESEKAKLENLTKSLRSELQSKANMVEELSGKLEALSDNLNALTQDQKAQDEKLEQASKQEARLQASEAEVSSLREQISKLKLEMTKNATLVEKLQAEKEANERNRGQRTALVGMLESQLSEMNDKYADANAKLEAALYDLSQKGDVIQGDAERIRKLEQELEESKLQVKRTAESLAAAQKGADAKSNKMLEALQKELQTTKQQMVRKSAAAQQLLQQRETECAELRKTNQALQQEVDKGSYSDRRIFELAAKQSNRESYQTGEIEVRDSIIDRLKAALLERDGDLASAEKHAYEVERQIEELFRIRRREDVNIDYLKSIVVQFLSLPPGSTERAGLLPVLATLLQFDDGDYKIIEEGKNRVNWWGSSVVPKMISPPAATTNHTGSAEVSVTSSTLQPSAKRTTSLQF
jgi:chromosome segregation ATPase